MYVIRVQAEDGILGVAFSGSVAPDEGLRAVSHAFALAEASEIRRCLCDIRDLHHGTGSLVVLGAALGAHSRPGQRVGLVCANNQISYCRRLARLAGFDQRLGTFTREEDAIEWLSSVSSNRINATAIRHLQTASLSRESGLPSLAPAAAN